MQAKRAENQQNVPIAVTAVSSDTLEKLGIADTSDLKNVAPSLNFSTAVGGFGLPRIRGVGSTGVGPGIENPVATYIDGVYISSPIGALTGLSDIEQVAVLNRILSLALIDAEYAAPGTELTFVWGEHPGPGNDPDGDFGFQRLKATVAPSPYNEHARTEYRKD